MYSEGVSICCFIIAGAFIWGGIASLIELNWWASIISLGIGCAILIGQIRRITSRKKLRTVVKFEFEQNPGATVEEIANKTEISVKDVQAIILDLKARGELRGRFSDKTGQLETEPFFNKESTTEKVYCPNCGTLIKKEASYCSFCGSKIN